MSFEIVDRAAAGRLGRFTTKHGKVTTPTLMPVVNPNIQLISPQEMRQLFGTQIVITNSYVFNKHERLRQAALEDGVHKVLDWDGPIMTDSGTFQQYVYGDVNLDAREIVEFQRNIGVDVATCFDRFVTPDMGLQVAEEAVAETIERTAEATRFKGESMLNATVQGGIFPELRTACAAAYRDLDVDYHTIGGVVPLMEQQRYPELVEVILASQRALRKDRPVHLFGAGHPLVFPLAVALGCDFFDSSSYAKYAKDGRMMLPSGTVHLADLQELPCHCPACSKYGVEGLRELPKKERTRVLAEHNLHVSFADMRRIRTAIREGTLWELVEQRAACHPFLAHATKMLGSPQAQRWLEAREPLSGSKALRYTGHLTHGRPIFSRIRRRLQDRVCLQGEAVEIEVDTPYADVGDHRVELGLHKEPANKPYREALGSLDATQDHAVISALGPVPAGLDEAYPFAQSMLPRLEGLDSGHMAWVGQTKDAFVERHALVPSLPGPGMPGERVDGDVLQVIRTADWQFGAGAGEALTTGELVIEKSPRTHKIRTVHLDGQHILSLRAGDGFFTLKAAGAAILLRALPAPAMRVVVNDDSAAFNRDGKSVFSRFVEACDADLRPGDDCLVVDRHDALVAVGRCLLMAEEMADFQTGMAVKVREGIEAPAAPTGDTPSS